MFSPYCCARIQNSRITYVYFISQAWTYNLNFTREMYYLSPMQSVHYSQLINVPAISILAQKIFETPNLYRYKIYITQTTKYLKVWQTITNEWRQREVIKYLHTIYFERQTSIATNFICTKVAETIYKWKKKKKTEKILPWHSDLIWQYE